MRISKALMMLSLSNIPLTNVIDIMFMNENDYLYEPNYNNWKDVNEPDY